MGEKTKYYDAGQNRRQLASDKKNVVRIQMKLTKSTDADILDKLDNVDNKQGYIKNLIREDIKKSGR